MIDFRTLVKAGVHFGHQKTRWCPKMAPYIWGFKNNTHLIDVSKTAMQLEKASQFLQSIAAQGKQILWIGTKKAAQEAILHTATGLNHPYVNHRWIGGSLSNNSQVRKSVTKLLHHEDIIAKADKFPHYTKKEFAIFQKMVDRLQKNVGGIRHLNWPVGAIVLVDVIKEQSALKEAARMGIPVVAMVDTNGDPSLVDYVIPANDDAPRSVKLVIDYLGQAVRKGQEEAAAAAEEKKTKAAAEKKKEPVKETKTHDEQAEAKAAANKVEKPKKAAAEHSESSSAKATADEAETKKVKAKPTAK